MDFDKKALSERDICTKYITPAIVQTAGWDLHSQIREEYTFTAGRVYVKGKLVTRGESKRADYILFYKPNLKIAVIEAKDNNHSVGSGMQQALNYAEMLDIPFVYSSNGDAFLEHDRTVTSGIMAREIPLDSFPTPAELFLLLISHLLQDGGRGGIVLPDGTLFGEGVKTRIKEKLLEDCNLHTIVRLPNGVFSPYTGIKTNLLFFTKGQPTQEIWYYEHPYPPGYKSYSKTKPIRIEEFAPEKTWWENREESEFAWKVPIQVIKDNGYNLDIKNPHTVIGDKLRL